MTVKGRFALVVSDGGPNSVAWVKWLQAQVDAAIKRHKLDGIEAALFVNESDDVK